MRSVSVTSLLGLGIFGLSLAASPATAAEAQPVRIRMSVPADASVWFNGTATTQTGAVREFVSPAVAADKNYTYQVRVRWTQDGKAVEQERSIRVSGGQQVNVEVNQQNMSVSREAFYPRAAGASGYYGGYPSSSSWSSWSGTAQPSWVPYDWADFDRFRSGRE
jgi:uncharacterized protein (TIGR03000 family)